MVAKKKRTSQKCNICDVILSRKSYLKSHIGSVHEENVHSSEKNKCNTCDATFKSKNSLKLHSETIHGGKSFTCTVCNASFLKRHI